FAVLDGVVTTGPNGPFILPSVTRHLVLELCARRGIPVREAPIPIERLRAADEVFLVGTTSEVLPVIAVDDGKIAAGRPGPITSRLQALFRELADGKARV